MQVQLQAVLDSARANLGDVQVVGGEVFTNTRLQPHFQNAWNEMFQCLQMHSSPRIEREFYWVLPQFTETFSPSQTAGLADFSEPELIEERDTATIATITSTSNTTPIRVTATAHGFSSGQEVIQTNITGTRAPWGRFFITLIDANTYDLNGSISDGQAGTGGIAVTGSLDFRELSFGNIEDGLPTSTLGTYQWRNGMFYFRGSTVARQLHILYSASGVPPTVTTQLLGLDDCHTYLAARTAGLAANSNGFYQMASNLNGLALGGSGQADGKSGLLRGFLAAQIKSLQRQECRRLPFRSGRRYQNQNI